LTADISDRQNKILDAIAGAGGHLHFRGIARKLGSMNRLNGDLVELVQKRCLHMERQGKENVYTITTQGLRCLLKHEGDALGESADFLKRIKQIAPDVFRENEELRERVAQLEDNLQFITNVLHSKTGLRMFWIPDSVVLKVTNPPDAK
jgi:hypothetical protein